MKKVLPWVFSASVMGFLIDWGIVGLKIMNGDYEFTALVYAAAVFLIGIFGCLVYYRSAKSKCPHCGKTIWNILGNEKYCPYCGKEIK
ncbi:MAG: hypothetical protein LUE95_02375 [Oscillospiraceae bacterium]|nr:hypothetical protein [Oscillospiraceae bacterium]